MRDPKRIPLILSELEKYWVKHPDLRLGQTVVLISSWLDMEENIWYLEDEDFLEVLLKKEALGLKKD